MRYTFKVIDDKGQVSEIKAMSFKKMRRKLDHSRKYSVSYINKKGNFQSKDNVIGIKPKW
jgi:hypothetical protein